MLDVAKWYGSEFIKAGDDVSEIFKDICVRANVSYSYLHRMKVLQGGNVFINKLYGGDEDGGLKSETDGVGTKVRIYMRQFNIMYEQFKEASVTKGPSEMEILRKEFQETADELMFRMMLDLYAMIVDDFRHGQTAISVTDIIDVNHIKINQDDPDKEQGIVWANAMKYALEKVIQHTQIALIAGETAILGAGDNEKAQGIIATEALSRLRDVQKILETINPSEEVVAEMKKRVLQAMNPEEKKTVAELQEFHTIIEGRMELNVGGAGNGILVGEKLSKMEAGHVVLMFPEQKTDKGIISPRANGISAIRRIENLLGDTWTNKTLDDFFAHPTIAAKPGAGALKQKFIAQGLTMDIKIWDVATGRTTVFNPFIGRELLGGLDKNPVASVSGLAHMTGNPPRKAAELLTGKGLSMVLDYSKIELPQIIEMCMLAEDLTFEQGFSMWNMGIPYIITCPESEVEKIIKQAKENKIEGVTRVGQVMETEDGKEPTVMIKHGDHTQEYNVEKLAIEK